MKVTGLFLLLLSGFGVHAQAEKQRAPLDTILQNHLARWQDLKFGLLMHWGTYSQWGIVESWSICPEDEGWTQRTGPYAKNYSDYVKAYENLQTSFNPVKFAPEKWAAAAKDAGMKYVIFTTKHHDGFCMFDTRETDYRITGPHSAFATNPKSNIAREIFDSFRQQGFLAGAYFSKADWHNENYWWPYFPPCDRNVNYDPEKYPDRWNAFKDFTYNQVKELMSEYGRMDILWLDAGWVRPLSTVDSSIEWQRNIKYEQDIDMKRIAAMARSYQPGLLIVDRTVTGEFENYRTPEQQVPDKPLSYPWETCMTMAGSWSYVPNDHYKPARELVQLLIRIVSRGGNLLLNIGPGPEGDWDPRAYDRLKKIGDWMAINGEGIYDSKPLEPYSADNIYYTQAKDGNTYYAFYLSDADDVALPGKVVLKNMILPAKTGVSLLGTKGMLKWKMENGSSVITVPPTVPGKSGSLYAAVFRMRVPK